MIRYGTVAWSAEGEPERLEARAVHNLVDCKSEVAGFLRAAREPLNEDV